MARRAAAVPAKLLYANSNETLADPSQQKWRTAQHPRLPSCCMQAQIKHMKPLDNENGAPHCTRACQVAVCKLK
eukprot:1157963-Pelagomonas_calceolata.AAC.2